MTWIILIIAAAIIGFYLRFLWAISKEVMHLRREGAAYRRSPAVARHKLYRVDPADLRREHRIATRRGIKDNF